MELKDQVVSPELAQKLKELGVRQAYFQWVGKEIWDKGMQSEYETPATPPRSSWTSAFTVAELREMLPDHVDTKQWQYDLSCWKEDDGWRIHYGRIGQLYEQLEAPTEADARAKMLIYLLENKLITL